MTETTLQDAERTRHRLEIMNQAFRGLLAIQGGGIVALLAYLQALGNDAPHQSRLVLVTILFLVVGLTFAVLFMTFRYHTSLEDQKGNASWRCWRWWSFFFLYGSIALFFAGMLVLVVGTLWVLSCTSQLVV
jgi:hypothetical protein